MITDVHAAGGVVWRIADGKLQVLVIERTRYRDLTLPKGKVDPGETLPETAVREIREETGLKVRLGPPVGVSRYHMPSTRRKIVHYWAAEATEKAVAASTFAPNKEVAAVQWMSVKKAREALSYPVDLEILDTFCQLVDTGAHRTFPLLALRHAKATARDEWPGSDSSRPLTLRGKRQAETLVGPLRAFGVRRIIASPALRCLQTVGPYAAALDRAIHEEPLLSEEIWEHGGSDLDTVIEKRLRSGRATVLCSHGPVLPGILDAIARATGSRANSYLGSASVLDPAAFSVVHLPIDDPGAGIVAIETHAPLF